MFSPVFLRLIAERKITPTALQLLCQLLLDYDLTTYRVLEPMRLHERYKMKPETIRDAMKEMISAGILEPGPQARLSRGARRRLTYRLRPIHVLSDGALRAHLIDVEERRQREAIAPPIAPTQSGQAGP